MDKTEAAKLLRKAWDGTSGNGPFLHVDIGDAKAIADLLDPPVQPPKVIPEGYKWEGEYRLPKRDEWFIAETNGGAEKASFDWSKEEYNRYIIYKIEPPEKVPEGYKWRKEKRLPKKDEWAINHSGGAFQAGCDYLMEQYYIIYKIEPKFKPGDIVIDDCKCVRVVTDECSDGGVVAVCMLTGGDHTKECESDFRMATDAEIEVYRTGNPTCALSYPALVREHARWPYDAKEAKQCQA